MRNSGDDSEIFQVPATDTKGHSVQKMVRMTPQMSMQIELCVSSRKWPYRTEAELIRHALVRHLDWMDKNSEAKDSLLPQIRETIKAVSFQEQHNEFGEVVDKVVQVVKSLLTSGNQVKANTMIDDVYKQVDIMIKKDGYWGNKYKRELDTKLSAIGIRMPRAGLKPSGFVKDDENG